jgi:hypothetical protein
VSGQTRTVVAAALRGANREALAGLEADLAFCHPAISGVELVDGEAGFVQLSTRELGVDEHAELERQVLAVVARSIQSYRLAEPTPPVWRHDARARAGGRASVARFVDRFTRSTGPGQRALIGPAALLREWLDRRARALAEELGAEAWHTPNIEMTDDLLARTGYLASYPQLVTFGYHLPPHYERIERFSRAAREGAGPERRAPACLEPAGFILEPAACHNVFRALRGERLDHGRTITALGTVYRYEGFRFEALLRQWEYSVREVVFLGAADWVESQRLRLMSLAQALVADLDLDATLEVATDPFFVGEAPVARSFQLMGCTKIELKLRLDDDLVTAAASFNRHGQHFSEPLDVRFAGDGALVESTCAGFGLERWMAAFVARWGAEPDAWPCDVSPRTTGGKAAPGSPTR